MCLFLCVLSMFVSYLLLPACPASTLASHRRALTPCLLWIWSPLQRVTVVCPSSCSGHLAFSCVPSPAVHQSTPGSCKLTLKEEAALAVVGWEQPGAGRSLLMQFLDVSQTQNASGRADGSSVHGGSCSLLTIGFPQRLPFLVISNPSVSVSSTADTWMQR